MCLQEVAISLLQRRSIHSWNNVGPSEASCDGKQNLGAVQPSPILLSCNTLAHKAPFNCSFILYIYFSASDLFLQGHALHFQLSSKLNLK